MTYRWIPLLRNFWNPECTLNKDKLDNTHTYTNYKTNTLFARLWNVFVRRPNLHNSTAKKQNAVTKWATTTMFARKRSTRWHNITLFLNICIGKILSDTSRKLINALSAQYTLSLSKWSDETLSARECRRTGVSHRF